MDHPGSAFPKKVHGNTRQHRSQVLFLQVKAAIQHFDESHENESFPLAAVMLEEQLHYVTNSNDPETSADYAAKFLHRILDIIVTELEDKPEERKREFQSMVIGYLSKLIQSDASPVEAAPDAKGN
jgi:hypothetical protein